MVCSAMPISPNLLMVVWLPYAVQSRRSIFKDGPLLSTHQYLCVRGLSVFGEAVKETA